MAPLALRRNARTRDTQRVPDPNCVATAVGTGHKHGLAMPRPWTLVQRVDTPDGAMELRRRGDKDFLISIDGHVLMGSGLTRSEDAVAVLGCEPIADRAAPRVLIGGLGLGFTMIAALRSLPADSEVIVAELNECVIRWCRDEIAPVTPALKTALEDKRLTIHHGSVMEPIRRASQGPASQRYDAIIWDLYVGPMPDSHIAADPLYSPSSLASVRAATRPDGVFAVWGERPDRQFEGRMRGLGFDIRLIRTKQARNAVYIGRLDSGPARGRGERPS